MRQDGCSSSKKGLNLYLLYPLDPFGEAELRALVAEEVRRAGS